VKTGQHLDVVGWGCGFPYFFPGR